MFTWMTRHTCVFASHYRICLIYLFTKASEPLVTFYTCRRPICISIVIVFFEICRRVLPNQKAQIMIFFWTLYTLLSLFRTSCTLMLLGLFPWGDSFRWGGSFSGLSFSLFTIRTLYSEVFTQRRNYNERTDSFSQQRQKYNRTFLFFGGELLPCYQTHQRSVHHDCSQTKKTLSQYTHLAHVYLSCTFRRVASILGSCLFLDIFMFQRKNSVQSFI